MTDRGIPLDPTCPLCTKPHGVEVSGDGYEHKCASCNAPITCAIGPDGGEMYPNIAPSEPTDDEDGDGEDMPTMTCPRCKAELPDFDGFGVLAHIAPMPDPCGYCTHPSADVVNGVSICGICGRPVEDPDLEIVPAKPTPQAAPMRDVHRIVEIVGERGGVQLVHVLDCGHWLTRRKVSTRLRCIGCVIEAQVNNKPLTVDEATTFVMGAVRAAERGMSDVTRDIFEAKLRNRIALLHHDQQGEPRGDQG